MKYHEGVGCTKCGALATHLEVVELDTQLFFCPEHYEEWQAHLPAKTDEYPDKEWTPATCFDCGSAAALTKTCEGRAVCDECWIDFHSPPVVDLKTEIKKERGCPPDQVYCPPFSCKLCIDKYLEKRK